MGLSKERIVSDLDALAARHDMIAQSLAQVGYPEPRIRERGFETLLRTIVGQQVSVAAATSIWNKLEAGLGGQVTPDALLAKDFDELRACGLSQQKQGYARSLSEHVSAGALDFSSLPEDDEEAIEALTQVKGIGRWSAEIYLIFAEGRGDIWPAGDLAVRAGFGEILGLPERPDEKQARQLAEAMSPHRSALAIFTWHVYSSSTL